MLKSIWKLIKILFIALVIFGLISMVLSLIVTFSLSAKIATEVSRDAATISPPETSFGMRNKDLCEITKPDAYLHS